MCLKQTFPLNILLAFLATGDISPNSMLQRFSQGGTVRGVNVKGKCPTLEDAEQAKTLRLGSAHGCVSMNRQQYVVI